MADRYRNDDRGRYRGSRYDRGDETNRGMFGYEGEGYLRGGGRDLDDSGRSGEFGAYGGECDFGCDFDRGEFSESDRYGSAGREPRGRDVNAGGAWGEGRLRGDYDRGADEMAGFRGTGYLGGDYGPPRVDRSVSSRDFSGATYGETRGTEMGDRMREQPSYRGRGPRNYRRSDERIREDVCERLERDDRVDATDVEVTVAEGVVTLAGSVNDRDMKRRAEDLAESCGGVTDVQNQIRVARKE